MPCKYRRCPAAGTYYALRRTEPPHLIFANHHDYEDFDTFMAQTLKRTGAELLGYCWMPDAIHLALHVDFTPLAEVMRRVTCYCSQRIHTRTGATARYIASFPMMLSEPESHLPMLLRYIHRIPVVTGITENPDEYPYTSHRIYSSEPRIMRTHTTISPRLIHIQGVIRRLDSSSGAQCERHTILETPLISIGRQ